MIIFWDLDETLRKNKRLTYEALKYAIRNYMDLNIDIDKLYELWDLANLEAIKNKEDNVFEVFLKRLFKNNLIKQEELNNIMNDFKNYVHSRIHLEEPFPYTRRALELVNKYKNGIISHAKAGSTIEWLKRYDLYNFFDPKLIYDGVKDKVKYMKGDFVYVGDSITDLYSFLRAEEGYIIMIREIHNGIIKDLFNYYPNKSNRVYFARNALAAAEMIRKLFKMDSDLN